MKKFKFLYFIFVLVLCSSLFFIGCGEVGFDDVPYTRTTEEISSVIEKIRDAKNTMLVGENLKMKYETVNTYTFFREEDKIVKDIVQDKYTTSIGVKDEKGYVISSITMTRKVNKKDIFTSKQTYVSKYEKNEEKYSYLYLSDKYVMEEETLEEATEYKDRTNFNSNYINSLKLFNEAVVEVNENEVDAVSQKTYNGVTYYRLDGLLGGLEAFGDRFVEDKYIVENPNLYTCLDPAYDSILSMSYEYGINSSKYLTYVRLKYEIARNNADTEVYNERYLKVESVTRLVGYGHTLQSETIPEGAEDYTAQSIINALSFTDFQLIYKDSESDSYSKVNLIKNNILDEDDVQNNENIETIYNLIIDQVGEENSTKKYFIDDENNAYLVDEILRKYQKVESPIDVTDFDFSTAVFENKEVDEKENIITYNYRLDGSNEKLLKVIVKDNEIYKLIINKNSVTKDYYIVNYKNNIENIPIINSLNGLEEVKTEVESDPEN